MLYRGDGKEEASYIGVIVGNKVKYYIGLHRDYIPLQSLLRKHQ